MDMLSKINQMVDQIERQLDKETAKYNVWYAKTVATGTESARVTLKKAEGHGWKLYSADGAGGFVVKHDRKEMHIDSTGKFSR